MPGWGATNTSNCEQASVRTGLSSVTICWRFLFRQSFLVSFLRMASTFSEWKRGWLHMCLCTKEEGWMQQIRLKWGTSNKYMLFREGDVQKLEKQNCNYDFKAYNMLQIRKLNAMALVEVFLKVSTLMNLWAKHGLNVQNVKTLPRFPWKINRCLDLSFT